MTLKELEKYVNWYIKRFEQNKKMYCSDCVDEIKRLLERKLQNDLNGDIVIYGEGTSVNFYYRDDLYRKHWLIEVKVRKILYQINSYYKMYCLKKIEVESLIEGIKSIEDLNKYVDDYKEQTNKRFTETANEFIDILNNNKIEYKTFLEIHHKWIKLNRIERKYVAEEFGVKDGEWW